MQKECSVFLICADTFENLKMGKQDRENPRVPLFWVTPVNFHMLRDSEDRQKLHVQAPEMPDPTVPLMQLNKLVSIHLILSIFSIWTSKMRVENPNIKAKNMSVLH